MSLAATLNSPTTLAPSADAISDWLRQRLSTVLGIDERAIDPDITFDRYGLDSVQAVEMTEDLGRALRLPDLSATLLYDYPTIHQLARHLVAAANGAA